MLLPTTRRTSSKRNASGRSSSRMASGLAHDLWLSGRVIRPKSLEELFNLMSEDELQDLLYDLKDKKRYLNNLHDPDGSKEERLTPEAAKKLDETIAKVEQHLGVSSDSQDSSFEGLQEMAASEIKKQGRELNSTELRLHCFMHIWAMIHGLRTKFARLRDPLQDFPLLADQPIILKTVKRDWDSLRQNMFKIYTRSKGHDCVFLPRAIVAVPDFHFLRERIQYMAQANSLLDASDDFSEHLNGCFVAINDPSRASKAQLELLQESIRGVSARKAMQVVRAEQLMDRKEQEGSLKRLRTGIAKHEEASIVCKDTEESLCAMLRAACQLRQGNRLNNSSSELLVVPIMRPSEGSNVEGSNSGASTSKQATKPQRLSAVIPEGYSYRFVLMNYNSNAIKQGLDSIRTHLEQKWQERPGEVDIAGMDTLNEESKEEIRWKSEMQVEADKRLENIVSTIQMQGGIFMPYLQLLCQIDAVEQVVEKTRDLCARVAVQNKRARGLRMREPQAKSGLLSSSHILEKALKLGEEQTTCNFFRFVFEDDSWQATGKNGCLTFERDSKTSPQR